MKKLLLVLVAMFGLYLSVSADGYDQCKVLDKDGNVTRYTVNVTATQNPSDLSEVTITATSDCPETVNLVVELEYGDYYTAGEYLVLAQPNQTTITKVSTDLSKKVYLRPEIKNSPKCENRF